MGKRVAVAAGRGRASGLFAGSDAQLHDVGVRGLRPGDGGVHVRERRALRPARRARGRVDVGAPGDARGRARARRRSGVRVGERDDSPPSRRVWEVGSAQTCSTAIRSRAVAVRRKPFQPLFDPSAHPRVDLPRCPADIPLRFVALRSGERLKMAEHLILERLPVLAEIGSERGPDNAVELPRPGPFLESQDAGGAVSRPRPDEVGPSLFTYPLPITEVAPRRLQILRVHQRPERPDGPRRRLQDKRHPPIVRFSRELDAHERAVVEPATLNGKLSRIPDERSPAKTGDAGQSNAPVRRAGPPL